MRQRRRQNLDSFGLEQRSHLLDALRIGAIAVADQQGFGVKPDHISSLCCRRSGNLGQHRNTQDLTERSVMPTFGNSISFAGTHQDQPKVGWERCIVGIDSVEGKLDGRRDILNLCTTGFQFSTQSLMLRLGCLEIRRMDEAKFPPPGSALALMPTGCARRTHEHSLQGAHHGMTVETNLGRGWGQYFWNQLFEAACHKRNLNGRSGKKQYGNAPSSLNATNPSKWMTEELEFHVGPE